MRDGIRGGWSPETVGKAGLAACNRHFQSGRFGRDVSKGRGHVDSAMIELVAVHKLALFVQHEHQAILGKEHIFQFAIAIQVDYRAGRQAAALHVDFPKHPALFIESINDADQGNQADVSPAIEVKVAHRQARSRRAACRTAPKDFALAVEAQKFTATRGSGDARASIPAGENDRSRCGPGGRGTADIPLPKHLAVGFEGGEGTFARGNDDLRLTVAIEVAHGRADGHAFDFGLPQDFAGKRRKRPDGAGLVSLNHRHLAVAIQVAQDRC